MVVLMAERKVILKVVRSVDWMVFLMAVAKVA